MQIDGLLFQCQRPQIPSTGISFIRRRDGIEHRNPTLTAQPSSTIS
ncbi:hypothetical protein L686_00635 [Stutzerimonas stutzeri MF28]|nr:hypothetical protein L686_00635 [Stutzerimonas stutzeri MF28]